MVDVGGHRLYVTCSGTGSPTIVNLHGWVNDASFVPHIYEYGVRGLLEEDYRVCLYDRRNVGWSDTVDGVQSPQAMLRELEQVLDGVDARPPYVLLAGSFGGLLAYDFLNHHPDDVAGMVMVDTMFPDELSLDRYLPEDATFLHYRKDDKCCTLERISQYEQIRGLQKYIGHEPAVPMIYLASEQEPRTQNDYQSPAYDARIIPAQKAFVARFAPGEFRWVDAPHWMEPVAPDQIAQAVRDVVAIAAR
jgi:predicted esterase